MGLEWFQQDALLSEETDDYKLFVDGNEQGRHVENFTLGTSNNCFVVYQTPEGTFGTRMEHPEMYRITAEERAEIQRLAATACPWLKCIFGKDAWVRWQVRWMAIRLKLFEPGKNVDDSPHHMLNTSTEEGIY